MSLWWIPWPLLWAFILGIVFLILVEVTIIYFLFFRNYKNNNSFSAAPSADAYTFPQQLYELISEKPGENNSEGTVLLNLLLQFWFRENRYDVITLTSIANKINSELTELLANTPLGRIFCSLKIHDIELGSESPTINAVSLQHVDVNKKLNTLNNFVFEFDINYVGGFYMAINALMKFNINTVFVSVKVVKCVGRVRVEFTRNPYTYWCMSFVTTPELELVVESHLKGHSLPQLNKIIGIQLRKRINRKFVMPFYKIRSKPFLPTHNLINIKDNLNEAIPTGNLHIRILSLSRITKREGTISCTLILDRSPWFKDVQSTANQTYLMQIFKRSNKDVALNDSRKLSTGSILFERHQDGLRHRLKSMTGQEDHQTIDKIVRRRSFADTSGLQQELGLDSSNRWDSDELNVIQQTKRVPYAELMAYDEQFKFVIEPPVRYLNIIVWNHFNEGRTENIIGYVSIALINLIHPGIGRKRRIFYLNMPSHTKNDAFASLTTHPGFNSSLCFGDITLSVMFSSAAATPLLSSNESTPVSLSPTKNVKTPLILEGTTGLSEIDSGIILSAHEFDRIVINRQTKCEFCQKKIWLKEGSRCIKCGFICHKKCVAKCEKTSECRNYISEDTSIDDESIEIASQALSINPEIVTTGPDTNNGVTGASKNKLSSFLANVKGMRRVGSTSNLAPPSTPSVLFSQVHSLPQTPNHSPAPSRKTSIVIDNVKLFESEAAEDEIEKALNYLITQPQDEQFLESVKSSGKKLCGDLDPSKREVRINEMIAKIKTTIDAENMILNSYEEQKKKETDTDELMKLSFLVGKREERLQALTNLLLYCCSGLQNSQHDIKLSC